MKYVKKLGAPQEYIDWCTKMKGKENEDYRELKNPEKRYLHKKLIREQGELCAYTMKRIGLEYSHIEHIKPETLCRTEQRGSDLDYRNLVACFPKEGMKTNCRYGAQAKDDWWENNGFQFISPLNNNCEQHFTFNKKGEISASHTNAIKTIHVLKLDDPILTDDRKRAIDNFIYGYKREQPISKKAAQSAIQVIDKPNTDGRLYEFCIAIKHALIEYVKFLDKLALKRKYSQK